MNQSITAVGLSLILAMSASAQLANPETVIYDYANQRYLVSNMSNGNIVAIDHDGSYTVFNSLLSSVYGMTIADNTLYVSSNDPALNGIVGFDLTTSEMTTHWNVTTMQGGNGMTADSSGNIYIADTGGSRIIKVRTSDGESSQFAVISIPNAVYFDYLNNRLLVASNVWPSSIYAVDMADSSVSQVTAISGQYSGIAQDQMQNTYLAFFAQDNIIRLDSTLTGSGELVAGSHNGPEGIFFNRRTSTLVIPSLLANQVDFVPMDIDLWFSSDTSAGWAPYDVQFDGGSIYDVESWAWDFGDGDSAFVASPTHTFDTPGLYDVALQVVSTTGDTALRVYPNQVFALADSVWMDDAEYTPDNAIEVVIHARNSVPLYEFQVALTYATGDLELVYDSFSTTGCRTDWYDGKIQSQYVPSSKKCTFKLRPRGSGAPLYDQPGSGPVLKLYFHAAGATEGEQTTIDLTGYDAQHMPKFTANGLVYAPVTTNGTVTYPACCQGIRGNVDDDPSDQIDIADLVYLVDFMFAGGAEPVCYPEANIDGDAVGDAFKQLTISDLVYLVDHMFNGGPAPPLCP
ncbi:MAG: PKD domain-containing protein [candidate division Zixibacteria bacterium]|nr:PKD domain-containing protein [candidate division Zixibacteria bacterium]MDH3936447.1 PKD domain-containing protein [candidate division Zixibacteria bacterium]MDH4032614.1 PKD domain-containing protein [candidate division Zixibacteria bacterium]